MDLDRRSFLKGALMAGAGAGVAGLAAGCAPQTQQAAESELAATGASESTGKHTWEVPPAPIEDIAETKDFDIIIVGAGVSGTSAAEAAAAAGAKVAVIEQAAGFTAHGADNACIGSRVHKENGVEIDPEDATRILYNYAQGMVNRDLIHTWATRSGEAFDHFSDLCAEAGIPTIMGISETSKPDWDTLEDRFREYRTGLTFGSADEGVIIDTDSFTFIESHLVETLVNAAMADGAEFFYNTHAEQLVGDAQSGISGVIVTAEDGSHVQYNASKGVILATGDIGGNEEMIKCWCPIVERTDVLSYFPENGNLGEGILMGCWAGAAVSKSAPAPAIHPISDVLSLSSLALSWLAVNSLGKRFCCEVPYEPYITNARLNAPGNVAWSIFDGDYERKVRAQAPVTAEALLSGVAEKIDSAVEAKLMYRADTLDDLAAQLGIPADEFKATVERYNELCASGNDVDFGAPARFLASVDTPPFHALNVPTNTMVVPFGLHVDSNSQVCTAEDEPIAGLFAVGNVQGDFFSFTYPVTCPGLSHGRSLTFGHLVGDALARDTTING